ncbi:hypothetical protein SLE2022_323610 [Rubroshorea leprosula]
MVGIAPAVLEAALKGKNLFHSRFNVDYFSENELCCIIPGVQISLFEEETFPNAACFDPVRHLMIEKHGVRGVRTEKALPLLLHAAGESGMIKNKKQK